MKARLALVAVLALAGGCYHLAYNQATYATDHGDYPTAVDKDLEALENVPDSVEARALWDRIWPPYRAMAVAACETAALDPDPTHLYDRLTDLETVLARSRKLHMALPEAPTSQLTHWHGVGASHAYALGETAESTRHPRQAADWFRLAGRFQDHYRDSAARFERNRRHAFVAVTVDPFESRGYGALPGLGLDDQTRSLVVQGLQPLNGDFLGIYGNDTVPDWAQHRFRLTGRATVNTQEPTDASESGWQQGLIPVPNGSPRQETVWYTRHHVQRTATVTLDLQLRRVADDGVVWQQSFTESASADHRWLTIDRGPRDLLSSELKEEADASASAPNWEALQDEAGVATCNTALSAVEAAVTALP